VKDILLYLQDIWNQVGYLEIVQYLATIAASFSVLLLLEKLGTMLWKLRQQRKLRRDLFPFYSLAEIQRATQYYVETNVQNVAPSKEEEPGRIQAFSIKEKILPFFLKKAFKPEKDDCQFYMVLADSGMGSTTFLINLYLRYADQFFKPSYQIKLFPLGFPNIDKEIEKISDAKKRNTILLLDAFNEDVKALQDYQERLYEIIQKILYFRVVVITCRTQFFPSEVEEPRETGVLRFGPEGGSRTFYKLYLSPFDDKDIRTYLRKRFAWFQVFKKGKAKQIVKYSPNLMVRPMLLSYIDDLLQSESPYTSTHMVYAVLIQKWIEREAHKVPHERRKHFKEELFRFSREIAVDIYRHRADRRGSLLIPGEEIKPFAEKHGINLLELEMKSRSLLNRDARGDYKFSHKSVLEYFLAEEAFFNAGFRKEVSFEGMDQAEVFFEEMIREKLTVPFFSRSDLKGEYSLKDGKPRLLTKIPVRILPEITYLKLRELKSSDNVLLFRGLRDLKRLDLSETQFSDIDALKDLRHLFSLEFSLELPRTQTHNMPTHQQGRQFELIKSPYRSGNLIQELEQGKIDMFYGRQETVQRLKHILIHDDDSLVIIYGQRRTGKSCLMKYIEKTKKFEPDLHVVFVGMQGLSSEQDFYDYVLRGMNKIVHPDQETISHVHSFNDFTTSFRQLLDGTDNRILVMVDEFECVTAEHFKYTSLANADEFIQRMRNLIQHTPNVKFALAGADGLKTMINNYSNPLFKAGRTVHIAFLHPEESRELITKPLTDTVNYTEPAIESIQEATFNHPYYIQCLCQRIVDVLNEKKRYVVSKIEVTQAIEEFQKAEQDMFEYVWDITEREAHLVLAVVAQEMREERLIHIDQIEKVIAENNFQIQGDILDGPIKQLLQKDLLFESNTGLEYTVPIGLLHTWIRRHKSLKRVRREFVS
jgi:hypothetical protein